MDIRLNVSKLAEAAIICQNQNGSDYSFQDESFDDQSRECLNIFVKTVFHFSKAFELDFEEIFSKHCNENMSEEQFLNFFEPRIKLLGRPKGNFGYILPCVFAREIMHRFKNNLGCSHLTTAAQNCLTEFLDSKFKEFEIENSWKDLLNYCKDINIKFYQLAESRNSARKEIVSPLIVKDGAKLNEDATEVGKNESSNSDKPINKAVVKLDFSDIDMQSVSDKGEHTNSENSRDDKQASNNVIRANLHILLDHTYHKVLKETNELVLCEDSSLSESLNGESQNKETEVSIGEEVEEIYDILMPDIQQRYSILQLIAKCESFLDGPDNEVSTTKVDKNCDLKSEERDKNSVERKTFCLQPDYENEKVEAPLFDASLENVNFATSTPKTLTKKQCYQCERNVQKD